ncbi:Interferon- developmental regulator 1 [Coemansia spiralis]|nr:Interferon- developmental regulator 1 [Coemansia spiralis]
MRRATPRESGGLLRTALNSGRTRSSGSGRNSQRSTPRLSQSAAGSRDVSDDEQADDTASVASDDTWLIDEEEDDDDDVGDNWEVELDEAVEALDEKRVAAREKGLRSLVQVMSRVCVSDALKGQRVTLLEALRRAARRTKSVQERELALRATALWFVTFGTESEGDEEFESTASFLQTLATDDSAGSSVQAGALGALGIANFVAGPDYRDAAVLARFVHDRVLPAALDGRAMDVARQAYETIGLLLTVVADSEPRLVEELFEQAFDAHLRGLTADSVEVRVAAAQNFALVHEALSDEADDGAPFEFERQGELVGVLEMLQHETSKRQGKRGSAAQRAAMRDVLATIEDGAAPRLRLIVHGRAIVFETWARIQRLHAFRAVLAEGLPVHFGANSLLQDVFEVEFDPATSDRLRNEARVVVNPSSDLAKARTLAMRRRREVLKRDQHYADDDDN